MFRFQMQMARDASSEAWWPEANSLVAAPKAATNWRNCDQRPSVTSAQRITVLLLRNSITPGPAVFGLVAAEQRN